MRHPVNRHCPLTDRPAARVLAYASAAAVARGNPTYRGGYADILGISPDDEFPFVEGPTGFVYSGWLPPDDFLERVYEKVIDHAKTVTTTLAYRQVLLEFGGAFLQLAIDKGSAPPLRLLDYGCGYGALLQILSSRDIVSLGYEPSSERGQFTTAERRFQILNRPEQLADAGPFDLIVCTEVLEHVSDPRSVLRTFRRLAAPGALLAITVPQCEPAAVVDGFATLARERKLPIVFNPWEHLNYFSSADLSRLLAEEGFGIVRDYGAGHSFRQLAKHVGEPTSLMGRALRAARLFRRALRSPHSTQLFCRAS